MGQTASDHEVVLTNGGEAPIELFDTCKLERKLRHLTETSDDAEIVLKWEKEVNKKAKSLVDRWNLASFAVKTLELWGKYKFMLAYSVYQIELGHEIMSKENQSTGSGNSTVLKGASVLADSYLNLAKANHALSHYNKSLEYSNKSIQQISSNRGRDPLANRLSGYCYLCQGKANLGLGDFKLALEDFEKALSLSHSESDGRLECLACCAMSMLYSQIKDFEKALFFTLKASDILQEHCKEMNNYLMTTVQQCLAETYRKIGKLDDAMRAAEDCMQAAIGNHNRPAQAYSMLCFADIHRVRRDTERALPRYDAAAGIMTETGDQYGRALVALGKAKAYYSAKEVGNSLAEYDTCLKIAEFIQNKMLCMRVHGEMALVYERVPNLELARNCTLRYHQTMENMNLICGICGQPIGEKQEQLETLPCLHFFHMRCASAHRLQMLGRLGCPSCRKKTMKQVSLREDNFK